MDWESGTSTSKWFGMRLRSKGCSRLPAWASSVMSAAALNDGSMGLVTRQSGGLGGNSVRVKEREVR